MTWLEAHVACEQYCSELAYLDSTDEAKKVALEIKGLMKQLNYVPDDYLTPAGEKKYEYGLDRRYWIGLNDLDKEGTWMWTGKNRTLDYDFWYPKQPDHNNNPLSNGKYNTIGEHCVVFWYPTFYTKSDTEFPTWNDEPCDNKHYAICDEPLLKIKTTKFGRECIPIKKSI
ncbi:unnamed protein product [Orchesella dallaii]|uniref:C-type lectin domain-containing protein n=1 Tax=Orchesella dallaii TaxID=48710 RepID=A0ABP1RCM9_9HEXA